MTPVPFWLMIVSRATAVLPVWRSPMMSSRCPRPVGVTAADDVSFLDEMVVAQKGDADVVLLEVQHNPPDVPGELEKLPGHRLLQPVDAGDAVPDGQDDAGLGDVDAGFVALDLAFEDLRDLICADAHGAWLTPSLDFPGSVGAASVRSRRRRWNRPGRPSLPARPVRPSPPARLSCRSAPRGRTAADPAGCPREASAQRPRPARSPRSARSAGEAPSRSGRGWCSSSCRPAETRNSSSRGETRRAP